MLFICSACVCTVPTTKDSLFPFLSLSLPLPPSSLSLWLSEEKGNVDSIKEQGSHLLLWFTALLGWVRSGRGGWIRVLGDFSCGSRKKATSIWQQTVRAVLAGRCTLLPHARVGYHILHAHTHTYRCRRTREKQPRLKIKKIQKAEWISERGDISLMGLIGRRNKQKLLTPITNMATQTSDHTWLLANHTSLPAHSDKERNSTSL